MDKEDAKQIAKEVAKEIENQKNSIDFFEAAGKGVEWVLGIDSSKDK